VTIFSTEFLHLVQVTF